MLRFLLESHCRFKKVFVWCKSGSDGQLDSEYLRLGNVTLVKDKLGYFDFLSYRKLGKFLISEEVDFVCDFSGNFAGRVLATANKAGVPKRISAYRGSSDRFKDDPFRRLYNRWVRMLTLKHSTNVIANSEAAFRFFFPEQWQKDSRFQVIYNGVNPTDFIQESKDLRKELGIADNSFVVGHTGRFNEAKNHSTIFAVAEILVKKHPDIYVILCGNGVKNNMCREVNERDLAGRVLVFENREDIPQFLNTMDCYFFPSVTEGQPNALIEAMIMGLPFVASDIEPIRETVGANYSLYPALDVEVLVTAIEEIYLARAGRNLTQQKEMIERFDHQKRFNEFYGVLVE